MVPNIFVSSTIDDLLHLREAIRDTIRDIGYNPVMSEYGDVGYMPSTTAEDSCYLSIRNCQLAILIIGKRYGSLSNNNLSVTHNEFCTARESKIPVICLVDPEVLSFKKVYDASSTSDGAMFPGMDVPQKTFSFIRDIIESGQNNAILPFSNVSHARELLKKQLAFIFGDLLASRYDPLKAEVKDILAEVMAMRKELSRKDSTFDQRMVVALRFLVDDDNSAYKHLIEQTLGPIDTVINDLLDSESFDVFLEKTGITLEIEPVEFDLKNKGKEGYTFMSERIWGRRKPDQEKPSLASFACNPTNKKLLLNPNAKEMFDRKHERFRLATGQAGSSFTG